MVIGALLEGHGIRMLEQNSMTRLIIYYGDSDGFLQAAAAAFNDELQTVAPPASQRLETRWPSGRPFTTLRTSVPGSALQTCPPTGCKQPAAVHNLIDGSVHNAFHLKNAFPELNPTHTHA